jgi:hypothetical protein
MSRKLLVAALLVAMGGYASPSSANVITNIYSNYNCCSGSGTPYSGFVGSLSTPGITFGTDTGFFWFPFGLSSFASDTIGTLNVGAGTQTFTLASDDGSQLFVDGVLAIDNGGAHGPGTVSQTLALTPGLHSFEVQFFECCGGNSGVDLTIPVGDSISSTPLPAALPLMGSILGAGFFVSKWRRRRQTGPGAIAAA